MAEPSPVGALLQQAAGIIRERGWRRGYSYGPGPVCLVRAIDVALSVDTFYGRPQVGEEALVALRKVTGSWAMGTWNDEHTKREVLAAIKKAVKNADAP